MKAAALACLIALGGCVVYSRPPYRPTPPGSPPEAGYAPAPAPAAGISQEQAIEIALRIAHDRGLDVSRVQHASLDAAGRWHVDVRGQKDRVRVLLDARDGRLLRGRFKAKGGGDHDRGRDDEDWDD